ncbi:hypothetical protein BC332_16358 [Capsicum chinense]|nr:hypothetical protein BC332_16358 [Capsicum chinense]
MAEKACVKHLQKEYRALCKVRNILVAGNCSTFEALPDTLFQPKVICNEYKLRLVFVNIMRWNLSPILWPALLQMISLSGLSPTSAHILAVNYGVKLSLTNELLFFFLTNYVLEGSEGTPFAGGYYYGKIKFPPEYPFKPPGISMTTPNGRFMTQKKICLSMSDFHPESWNPMWSVSSILTGLLSFMVKFFPINAAYNDSGCSHFICLWFKHALHNAAAISCSMDYLQMDNSPTTGSASTTVAEKEKLAKASLAFNCKNSRSPARETDMLFYRVFFV